MDFSAPFVQHLISVLSIFVSAFVAYKYWLIQRRKELADNLFAEFHSVEILKIRRKLNKNLVLSHLQKVGADRKLSVSEISRLCVPGAIFNGDNQNSTDTCSPYGDLYTTDEAIELSHLFHFFERIVILEEIGDLERDRLKILFGSYFDWWTKNLFDKIDLSPASVGEYRHVLTASKIRYLVR